MSASEASWQRWNCRIRVGAVLAVLATCSWAQEAGTAGEEGSGSEIQPAPVIEAPFGGEFPLGAQARSVLAQLQADWLDWLVACNEGDAERADAAITSLLSHVELMGMERVPALSSAAAVRAIEFAEAGDPERARWGLEAARRIDPQRPEAAFAAARVARLEGRWGRTISSYAKGWWLSLRSPQLRYVLLNNLLLWVLAVLTLAGLLLVGAIMAARGQILYFDLYRFFHRYTPGAAAHLLVLSLLCWPLLLPAGILWTVFFWTALLWSYSGRMEKALLLVVWLIVGSLPAVLTAQGRRVGLALFAPVHSVESAARGELEGELFNHLALLQSVLPESVALEQFGADVHRKLGQMELARTYYRAVLDHEPANQSALNDLGIYYFEASDYDQAAHFFSRAAESGEPQAPIMFNLSQAYSELYRFTESQEALFDARALGSESVNKWLQRDSREKVVALNGGLGRVDEVRSELQAQWRVGEELPTWFGHWLRALSLPLVVVLILIAVVVRLVTRRGRSVKPSASWWGPRADRIRRVLLTGVPEAEDGRSAMAAVWLVTLVGLATLPAASLLGYRLPWLHEPPPMLLPAISALGLAIFFLARVLIYGRGDR
jgi:tetratricopeptide (TPR) repeat protein